MSDLHYGHSNVLRLSHRDNFSDVGEMNSYILETLHNTLQPGDTVFDLGDLAWKANTKEIENIVKSCNGASFIKILGNHDSYNLYRHPSAKETQRLFTYIADYLEITVLSDSNLYPVVLFHCPIEDYPGMYRGGLHLFGHVHGNLDQKYLESPKLMADVGFDSELSKQAGSFLVPFQTILEHFYEKTGGLSFLEWARQNQDKYGV